MGEPTFILVQYGCQIEKQLLSNRDALGSGTHWNLPDWRITRQPTLRFTPFATFLRRG